MKAIVIYALTTLLSSICQLAISSPCACARGDLDVIAAETDDNEDVKILVILQKGQCLLQDLEDHHAYSKTWITVIHDGMRGFIHNEKVTLKDCPNDPEEDLSSGKEDLHCRKWKYRHQTVGSAYFPADDGEYVDMRGLSVRTLQDYLADRVTFVTVAMDTSSGIEYGTQVCIPELNIEYGRMIDFRVMDTTRWLQGYSYSRVGICVRTESDSESEELNGPLTLVFK